MSVFATRPAVTKVTLTEIDKTFCRFKRPIRMRFLVILLLSLITTSSFAEEIVFEMRVWGYKFGTMTVGHTTEEDGVDVYTLKASGKVNFLWMKREGSTDYRVIVKDGRMLSSSYSRTVNGEIDYWNEVKLEGDKYSVESSKGSREFSETPDFNVLALYFNPITEFDRIYCEAESEFSTITKRSADGFELSCTDGSRTSYFLKEGEIDRLVIHAAIASVKIDRVY